MLVKTIISLSSDLEVLSPFAPTCHTGKEMPKDDGDFHLYPCVNGLTSESLDDYAFEVEALVAGSKDDEKKLDHNWFVGLVESLALRPSERCTCLISRNQRG